MDPTLARTPADQGSSPAPARDRQGSVSAPEWAPVQGDEWGLRSAMRPGRVPWAVHVLAWKAYEKSQGPGCQSAERIADRGGFGWGELCALLRGEYLGSDAFRELREIQEQIE